MENQSNSIFAVKMERYDFEGYPVSESIKAIKPTKESAEKFISTLPKPKLCYCGEHTDIGYSIEEVEV